MTADLQTLTEALLSAAKSAGADAADAMALRSDWVSVEVLNGALETAERAETTDIGLRVLVGQRQATVASSELSPATITEMAERAVAMARLAPEDPYLGLADPSQLSDTRDARGLELCDDSALSPAELEEQALAGEAAALAVSGVAKTSNTGASQRKRSIHIAASNGFAGAYSISDHSRFVTAISGEGLGMERDYCGETRVHMADLPPVEEVGRIAGERAASRAGARKPPTGAYPVVYDERISGSLIGHLCAAINGSAIARGSSWLRDAMGETVLPKGIDLITDPHRPRIGSARNFDVEGLPTARRHLVRDGVLQGWVLDLGTARQLGLASTGNAARGVGSGPSPTLRGVMLTEGTQSRDEMLQEIGTGLLVTSLIGSSINATTGDYSRGASGFWVEGGEIAYPVNECTIAGNLRDMLRGLRPANDARHTQSSVVPSLLVEGLTIAGA